jgi:hypothetical protein
MEVLEVWVAVLELAQGHTKGERAPKLTFSRGGAAAVDGALRAHPTEVVRLVRKQEVAVVS